MAAETTTTTPTPPPQSSSSPAEQPPRRLGVPSRNPLPLSASQEAQVREVFHQRVRAKCSAEIKAFADCALNRTFSAAFACRAPNRAMNGCMVAHATAAEHDAAREQWFAERAERARERERKARRKLEQEAFLREWWGLPEKDREEARREMERSRRGERVGGLPSRARRRVPGDDGKEEEEAGKKSGR